MASDNTLSAMPEEILMMVFKVCFADLTVRRPPPKPKQPQTAVSVWRRKKTDFNIPGDIGIIFVCKNFSRIALLQFYSTAAFHYEVRLTDHKKFPKTQDGSQTTVESHIRNIYAGRRALTLKNPGRLPDMFPLDKLHIVRLEAVFTRSDDGKFIFMPNQKALVTALPSKLRYLTTTCEELPETQCVFRDTNQFLR